MIRFSPGSCCDCPPSGGCQVRLNLASGACGSDTTGVTVTLYTTAMAFVASSVTGDPPAANAAQAYFLLDPAVVTAGLYAVSSRYPTKRQYINACGLWSFNDCLGADF